MQLESNVAVIWNNHIAAFFNSLQSTI